MRRGIFLLGCLGLGALFFNALILQEKTTSDYDSCVGVHIPAHSDPLIQAPFDTQMLNRYSYVRNNPLNATDPSGYFAFLPALIAIASSIGGAALVVEGFILAGLALAFAGNFAATLIAGGSIGDAFISEISSAAFAYVGGSFNWAGSTWKEVGMVALKFGAIGGITSVLQRNLESYRMTSIWQK